MLPVMHISFWTKGIEIRRRLRSNKGLEKRSGAALTLNPRSSISCFYRRFKTRNMEVHKMFIQFHFSQDSLSSDLLGFFVLQIFIGFRFKDIPSTDIPVTCAAICREILRNEACDFR